MSESEEMTINGSVYVLKDMFKPEIKEVPRPFKEAKRFSGDKEHKIIGKLNQIFTAEEKSISEEEAVENGVSVICPSNICMVTAKTEEAKRILARYCSFESERKKNPNWNFKPENLEEHMRLINFVIPNLTSHTNTKDM